jgi:hypothetical protein
MCRSIKRLRERSEIASDEEIRAAALQFVRKVSGFQRPSQRNEEVFEQAVDQVTAAAARLLRGLTLPVAS